MKVVFVGMYVCIVQVVPVFDFRRWTHQSFVSIRNPEFVYEETYLTFKYNTPTTHSHLHTLT